MSHWSPQSWLFDLLGAWGLHHNITRVEIQPSHFLPITWHYLDRHYWSCSWADWLKIIDNDWLNRRGYQGEEFDCDDYAIAFKARMSERYGLNAVALIIDMSSVVLDANGRWVSRPHAYNVIFPSDGDPIAFEPQNDATPSLGFGLYMGISGMVVL